MIVTYDEITRFISSGQPAGRFSPEVIMYSEYEVRTGIYHAMCYIEERIKSENAKKRIDEAREQPLTEGNMKQEQKGQHKNTSLEPQSSPPAPKSINMRNGNITLSKFIKDLQNEVEEHKDWGDRELEFHTIDKDGLLFLSLFDDSDDDNKVIIDIGTEEDDEENMEDMLGRGMS